MIAFGLTAFLFPTIVLTVDGESPDSFAMSVRFRYGPRFGAAKFQISRLPTIACASSWSWFQAIENGKTAGRTYRPEE